MNPMDANRDIRINIQTPTPGGNDHVKANHGGSETNHGYNRFHTRVRNQKNIGDNQRSIKHQGSNFTGANESLRLFLSPTERRDMVQFIKFKELIITNILENINHPADIVKLISMGSIPVIPLPTFTKVVKEYGFTNADGLTTVGKEFLSILLTNNQKQCGNRKGQSQHNIVKLYGTFRGVRRTL